MDLNKNLKPQADGAQNVNKQFGEIVQIVLTSDYNENVIFFIS